MNQGPFDLAGQGIEALTVLGRGVYKPLEAHRLVRGPHVRWLAHQHFVGDAGQTVHVGWGAELRAPDGLFGAHVPRGPKGEACPGELLDTRGTHRLGNAEITDDRMSG